jgi:hypothetical protein
VPVPDELGVYWLSIFIFERALALVYFVAFVCAANQFVPLLGSRGLLPAERFIKAIPFRRSPSLFYLWSSDTAFRMAAWIGIGLSCLELTAWPGRSALVNGAVWAAMWLLYLSFVNVGQVFYGFGWESMLLEAGFFALFLGGSRTAPSAVMIWSLRWILFRDMFGAGLIKMRGDRCWRDLTCLNYYFETQPIPNPLSWFFHWLPERFRRPGVLFNHIVELGVPFLYFLPQPFAAIGGLLTIAFQLTLIVSGNLSWLNWLTIVLAVPTLDDRWFSWLPIATPALRPQPLAQHTITYGLGLVVILMSIRPILNMLSRRQLMNFSYNPLHLVNTYGAFGSITRERNEIVIEGTDAEKISGSTVWREYGFKGKPGDTARFAPQIAPYHLRLDWLMWFAAMSEPFEHPWFTMLLVRLLEGDGATLGLLRNNPFPDRPPRYVRALYYSYRFTTPEERKGSGRWWSRALLGLYHPPVTLETPSYAAIDSAVGSSAASST